MPGKPGTPDLDVDVPAPEPREAEVKVVPAGGVVIGEQEARQLQALLEGKPVPDDVKQRLLGVVTPKTTIQDRLADLLVSNPETDPDELAFLITRLVALHIDTDVYIDRTTGVGRVGLQALRVWLDPE